MGPVVLILHELLLIGRPAPGGLALGRGEQVEQALLTPHPQVLEEHGPLMGCELLDEQQDGRHVEHQVGVGGEQLGQRHGPVGRKRGNHVLESDCIGFTLSIQRSAMMIQSHRLHN